LSFEKVLFSHLIHNEDFSRKVIPFLKEEYFHDHVDKTVFNIIDSYVKTYNKFPSKEAIVIDLSNSSNISEETYKSAKSVINSLERDENSDLEWLLDKTEQFCQEKAVYNAIMSSIQIIDDKSGKLSKGSIPSILSDALAVSFDTNIGHDFIDDASARYDFYHRKEERIPFGLEYLDKITKGGLPKKTLSVAMSTTGGGKSLFMCHCAATNLAMGRNVLYITMEMAEERIAERIDANLLDTPIDELELLPKDSYQRKIDKVKSKTIGKLIIKEYPTGAAGSANFRHLLNELKLKKNFIPEIIYVDYLNICASSRLKNGSNINSYTYVKAIVEELRGLAIETNTVLITATQSVRSSHSSSDVELSDTSESWGVPQTADFFIAIINNEELQSLNQVMIKQLKNRFSDLTDNRRFVLGIDKTKMRLYDVEQSAQDDVLDGPIMDKTEFGNQDYERNKPKSKFNKKIFEEFV
jgi:KaiC/GvpD/RAD55 family RecA-like ATPase